MYIDSPGEQIAILGRKYAGRDHGRIRLPRSNQELWAAHKYSVLARDQAAYRAIGRRVSRLRRGADVAPLALELVELLRGRRPRAISATPFLHMWGTFAIRPPPLPSGSFSGVRSSGRSRT